MSRKAVVISLCLLALTSQKSEANTAPPTKAKSVLISIQRSSPPPDGLEAISATISPGAIELTKNTSGFGSPKTDAKIGLFKIRWAPGSAPTLDSLVNDVFDQSAQYHFFFKTQNELLAKVYGSASKARLKQQQVKSLTPHGLRWLLDGISIEQKEKRGKQLASQLIKWLETLENAPELKPVDAIEVKVEKNQTQPVMKELAGPKHSALECKKNSRPLSCRSAELGIIKLRVD